MGVHYRDIEPRTLDPDRDPWEQQPGETVAAHQRFTAYRDMAPTRSLRRLARSANVTLNAVSGQAKREQWTARCQAWDRHLRQLEDAELVSARKAAAKRHATIAASHLSALSLSTQELARRVGQSPELMKDMPLEQVMRIEAAMARATPRLVATERLALGMSTENVDVMHDRERDLAQRTDGELDDLLTGGGADPADPNLAFAEGLEAGARAAMEIAEAASVDEVLDGEGVEA